MSAPIGIFTRAFAAGDGLGQNALKPLPVREEGSYGLGKGRAAGHRVQLADWAYLLEAAEQRATWSDITYDMLKHDVYPHNEVDRYYDSQGTEIYNTEITLSPPSSRAWSAVTALDNGRFFKTDVTPPAYNDVFWSFGTSTDDKPNYLYTFATPASRATGRLRRVDDVRCLFYDVKSCTRADTINGSYIYYDNGTPAGPNAPRVDTIGPYRADDPDHAVRYEADECRVINNQGTLHALLGLHREVVAHTDFAAAPAYAIVQLRCTQQHQGAIVRNYARYVRASWTLNAQAGATINLAACGCDTSGLVSWMDAAVGSYVTDDVYIGTARVVDLIYDLTLPMDRGLFYGWTWQPS